MKPLNKDQYRDFMNCKNCPSCNIGFAKETKVRHHCHITGNFISALCNKCNLAMKFRKPTRAKWDKDTNYTIPILMHNMRGYDSHIILKHMTRFFAPQDINVIATNMEKYMAFEIDGLRFLDSMQFLNCGLDTLVQNLLKGGDDNFKLLRHLYGDDEQFQLLLRKGVYPYEYMDGPERMRETCLPPKQAFFSRLSDSDISDTDYHHAQNIWSKFRMHNMQQYHDLYLTTDVILLADVFEGFRKMSLNYYGLDPCHYFSAPGLSMDACLRMTGVSLELLTDPDQHLFVEEGLRGGVSMISHRFAAANNKYIPDTFDPSADTSYIMYLDCNNLYGFAMSEPLPKGKFRFLTNEEIDGFDITSKDDDDDLGYILEVDLDYPSHLHSSQNDYPLAPQKLPITPDMLSPYALNICENIGKKVGISAEKLVPNLLDKKNYTLHYRNLKYYLKMGLKLTKIHKILEFQQSRWLKPYIDFNTSKRQVAKSSFEKDLFKLMNNSVFGKTCERKRKHMDIRVVTSAIKAKRYIARPTFQSFQIINDEVTAIKLIKADVYLNKPLYIGMCILDISKLQMYQFHYDHILSLYGERAKLLFTDTDSLCYHIRTEDVYSDMSKHLSEYDTSDYPASHPLYSTVNGKVIGKFKDECNGVAPLEFVGLRAKMYSLLLGVEKEKKTAKGIKKSFVSKHIRHNDYKTCLFSQQPTQSSFYTIRSKNHLLHTTHITKTALSAFDDKRYLLNSTDSLAYGHVDIPIAH